MDNNIYNSLYYQALSIIAAQNNIEGQELYNILVKFATNEFLLNEVELIKIILIVINDITEDSYVSAPYETIIRHNKEGNIILSYQWNYEGKVSCGNYLEAT